MLDGDSLVMETIMGKIRGNPHITRRPVALLGDDELGNLLD
jgi:hypothetical protein